MQKDDVWLHSVCNMCPGDCGILVHRVNGVVVDIKGDPDCPNSRGKNCSKAYAAIIHLYDPHRVTHPMKRTNPEKGLGVDPGWKPVSWDEALDLLEKQLVKIKREDPRKLVVATFDTPTYNEVVGPFAKAFGTTNSRWTGYFCGQYLHSSMYLTNGTFHCDFDADYIKYLMLFGNQAGFGAGLNPNITIQKVAEARKRGLKIVVVDPVCTPAAAKADEWVPIRPGTDGALVLAMINILLNRLGIYDRGFIARHTNGPYLVKPDGFYLRQEGKPMLWDAAEGKAKPYDTEIKEGAIEGTFTVDGIACRPAFEFLKEHVKKYTPEMAAGITTVPVAAISRLAEEFGRAACIGSTIAIDGQELPYRPVAANIYRGAGAHKHGVGAALGVQLLNMVVGDFYVPGGHRGTNIVGPAWQWAPGEYEGLVTVPSKPKKGEVREAYAFVEDRDYYTYRVGPPADMNLNELYPISTNRSPIKVTTSIDPEKFKLPYKPEVLLVCRRNLFMGGCDYDLTAAALRKIPFIAHFAVTINEMSDFADLVLPESVGLEKLHAMPNTLNWSHTIQTGCFYWGLRQPIVPPLGEARDWGDVLLELADRIGILGKLYAISNTQNGLKEKYQLDPARKYTRQEIADQRFKSQFGEEKGLDWFKENGFVSVKRKVDELYPLPWLKARFPIYYENVKDAGAKVKGVAESLGIKDWDISDYDALPDWKPCASYAPTDGYDLKACNFRLATHAFTYTAQVAWLCEVSEINPYGQKILINTETAKRKGISDRDRICVESPIGKVEGFAKVTECVHPEAVGMSSHFGTLSKGKPVAYGKGASFNKLVPYDTDPVSTGVDACVRVKVYKV